MRSTIYFDYNATTPVDPRVFDVMKHYFCQEFGNPHSSEHYLGWQADKAVQMSRDKIAKLIGADPDEIFFTSGATEANNLALLGSGRRAGRVKTRILISSIEHKCVIESAVALKKTNNFEVNHVFVDQNGKVNLDHLLSLVNDDVLLISIMAVNNEIGTLQDLEKIGQIAREHGIIYHCDAAQAPCALNIDVFKQNIDMLSLSSHKFYGPKGIGALYIRRELQDKIEPIIYGGGQQGGLRSGTIPVPLCVGMGAAAELILSSGGERNELRQKTAYFWSKLQQANWQIHLNGPELNERHPGNLNVRFPGFFAQDILASLQPQLAAASGAACTSGVPGQSHVLRAIGLSEEESSNSIRFSLGRFTSFEEIDEAVVLIDKGLQSLGLSR
ncbi:MAG: cysteine desulfurase [Candidatus Cloacimonetes bacterium]|nr:cysteine desulfurase [Candidatus Cloacimonadota bacterium]MDY0172984.1 cysteine desulfurase family protein [Candidatus Cloacimonadaceae bacterium]